MWYVIQVMASNEIYIKKTIESRVNQEFLNECYVPLRRMKKKFHGRWNVIEEILFPGYVFIDTDVCEELFFELKKIKRFTKMLSDEEGMPLELGLEDLKILNCLRGVKDNENKDIVEISHVFVENQKVLVKDGPLKGFEGKIKKFDLHKRIAIVEMEFFGEIRNVHLGIDIIEANVAAE